MEQADSYFTQDTEKEKTRGTFTLKSLKNKSIPVKAVALVVAGIFLGMILTLFLPSLLPGASRPLAESILSDGKTALDTINNKAGQQTADAFGKTGSGLFCYTEYIPEEISYHPADEIGKLPIDDEESYTAYLLEHTNENEEYIRARWDLYQTIVGYGLNELQGLVVEAFLRTPRQFFVREKNLGRAYEDTWLPVGYGATITDPDVVAMMTTTLDVRPGLKVLEIGTGSGYQSAILSNLTEEVYSIEIIEPLFYETNELYHELAKEYPAYNNIRRKLGDGYYGWVKYAPFDRIIVTCAIDHLPPQLLQQLTPDGIMVVPLGQPGRQYIIKVVKTVDEEGDAGTKRIDVYNGLSVKFIPFRNEAGSSYSAPE
ncbi:MAG: protein-L-isoaspartate O-methyltransferase [Spirochaetales bacterium]|nr:protein-L-isoaspartate O-methyltransferase [Spirochaetales bacterium]